MADNGRPPPLEDLDARLKKARGGRQPVGRERGPGGSLGQALSIAVEMAAALAVGGGLGWLLDSWLGTEPWLLVVFIFTGIGAGVRNAFRAARRFEQGSETRDEDGGGQPPR